ncbi:MAG: radical SAM/CxCxxxxC motif protein YfkAB [Paenibacillaceae bacterium]
MIDKHMVPAIARPINALFDPWDPLVSLRQHGRHVLTSVEFTVSNLCNMRCEHCAVGDTLTMSEPEKIPLDTLLRKLDQVEHLQTISITGGEPTYSVSTVQEYIIPLLQYAQSRGIHSQLNSNLTLNRSRYEEIAPYLDVMHISFNYLNVNDFTDIGFARANKSISHETTSRIYEQMIQNAQYLSSNGLYISAESMINYRTHDKLPQIHQLIAQMGCKRHEVHPMYPSSFASQLPVLSLERIRESIHSLLDHRDPQIWMLFGTLPMYRCNDNPEDQRLLKRLETAPNVTVRNDPDGRNRLNVNVFTGDVLVTDFAAIPPLGSIHCDSLDHVFDRWMEHPLSKRVTCYCPVASCCGPNLLVADTYYKDIDFMQRKAIY